MVRSLSPWRSRLSRANSHGEWQLWAPGSGIQDTDPCTVASRIRQALPPSGILVSPRHSDEFLAPPEVNELRDVSNAALGSQAARLAILFLAVTVGLVALRPSGPAPTSLIYPLASVLMGILLIADVLWLKRYPDAAAQRWRFFFWLRTQSGVASAAWACTALITLIGLYQVIAYLLAGGPSPLFRSLGFALPAFDSGQYWRVMTGPFLHYDVWHFSVNTALVLISGAALGIWLRPVSIIALLLVSTPVTALLQMSVPDPSFELFAGISGGAYTLSGCAVTLVWIGWYKIPKALGGILAAILVLAISVHEVSSPRSATVAHLSGLALGIGVATLLSAHGHWNRSARYS